MNDVLAGQIRHLVTAASALAVAHGYAITGSDTEIIAGIVVTIITMVWSALSKKGVAP